MNGKLTLVHQQSILETQGEWRALRACVPACFYMLGKAHDYLADVSFEDFTNALDWQTSRSDEVGWMRHRLSAELRQRHGLEMVTWPLRGTASLTELKPGSVATERESEWFESNVKRLDIRSLVSDGTPVIVTVSPGFGMNQSTHAVVLHRLVDGVYHVLDPDKRNPKDHYTLEEVGAGMAYATGDATVILPALAKR